MGPTFVGRTGLGAIAEALAVVSKSAGAIIVVGESAKSVSCYKDESNAQPACGEKLGLL